MVINHMHSADHNFNVKINDVEHMITEQVGWNVYWVGKAKK